MNDAIFLKPELAPDEHDGVLEETRLVEEIKEGIAFGLVDAGEAKNIFMSMQNELSLDKSPETEEAALAIGKMLKTLDAEAEALRAYWLKINR